MIAVRFTGRAQGDLRDPAALEALRAELGLERIVCGPQVHGVEIAEDDRPADGRLARTAGVGCLVFVADCLPVALQGPGGVCMAHAGWRGLAGGVLEAAVDAVGATHAVIGPGAGPCCYEVGPEVFEAFGLAPQRARIDMKALAAERLAGLEVQDVGVCTICSPEHFSHRRDKTTARQAGIAWLT
ncbi:MAG TPA: polyphenol oxidase family protein [Solirubrobacteraceae bacterium]